MTAARRTARAALLLLLAAAGPAVAQVGHAPDRSPYRDIRGALTLSPWSARFGGDGGIIGVGPQRGDGYGLRVEVRTDKFIQIGASFGLLDLERFVVDPFVAVADRRTGPVDQRVLLTEIAVQLNLTGRKSWRGFAPYVGLGLGAAFGSTTPADTSGYRFGTKLAVTPNAGLRYYVSPSTFLRLEAGSTIWRLGYPVSFRSEPPLDPGIPPNSNAVLQDGTRGEWVSSGRYLIGIGFPFPL